jgi:hypothetical protein
MGTTTSRPILHGIESFLLQIAQFVDVGVRLVERLLSSLFSLCLPSTLFPDYQIDERRDVPFCDKSGVCHVPATTRVKQHAQFKQRYEERLKRRKLRAEWAAAGLDVVEMERQEQAKRKRQQQKATMHQMDEKYHAEQMLGPVAKAPQPRPEEERETAAERAKGKLWVMGNVAPREQARLPKSQDKPEVRMPELMIHRRGAALESVRETSIHEPPSPKYAVHGHGSRIASGVSDHGDVSYQIVATSRDRGEASSGADGKAEFRAGQRRKVVTSQGIMPSQAQVLASTSSASRLDAAVRPVSKEYKAAPSSSPSPKLVQPLARRHHRSLDLVASQDLLPAKQHDKRDPIDLRSDSPRFFNRARASLDMVTTAAASQMSRPSSPSSPAMPVFSSASSDAGSIASRRSIFGSTSPSASISRSSTPPCVTDLADKACKSRWQANARERKVWKDEVDRITLDKLQRTSKRHHLDSQLPSPISNSSDSFKLALLADKRLRRVSLEPKSVDKAAEKVKRRSFQKPSHHCKDI